MRQSVLAAVVFLFTTPLLASASVATPMATPSPEPVHDRCQAVPPETLDWIAKGLDPADGTTLGTAWAVRSDDFENVWFVAADLDGPALDADDDTALWATNAITEDGRGTTGAVFSVNGMAEQFSDWPDADAQDITGEDDGAQDVMECVTGDD